MTEPERFDRLLSSAWQTLSPPSGMESRVRARLTADSVAAGAAPPRRVSRLQRRLQALRATGGAGASAAVLLLGLGFAAGYLARPSELPVLPVAPAVSAAPLASPRAPASAGSVPATAAARPTEPAELEPSGGAEPHPRERRAARKPGATVSRRAAPPQREPAANGAKDELLLLERAERAVRARHPELALALTAELEQRFPGSPLQEERRAVALLAQCQRGGDEARELAESFVRRYPGSVYAERITMGCRQPDTSAITAPANSALTIDTGTDTDRAKGGNFAQPRDP
jgi:hypothetical protein